MPAQKLLTSPCDLFWRFQAKSTINVAVKSSLLHWSQVRLKMRDSRDDKSMKDRTSQPSRPAVPIAHLPAYATLSPGFKLSLIIQTLWLTEQPRSIGLCESSHHCDRLYVEKDRLGKPLSWVGKADQQYLAEPLRKKAFTLCGSRRSTYPQSASASAKLFSFRWARARLLYALARPPSSSKASLYSFTA